MESRLVLLALYEKLEDASAAEHCYVGCLWTTHNKAPQKGFIHLLFQNHVLVHNDLLNLLYLTVVWTRLLVLSGGRKIAYTVVTWLEQLFHRNSMQGKDDIYVKVMVTDVQAVRVVWHANWTQYWIHNNPNGIKPQIMSHDSLTFPVLQSRFHQQLPWEYNQPAFTQPFSSHPDHWKN